MDDRKDASRSARKDLPNEPNRLPPTQHWSSEGTPDHGPQRDPERRLSDSRFRFTVITASVTVVASVGLATLIVSLVTRPNRNYESVTTSPVATGANTTASVATTGLEPSTSTPATIAQTTSSTTTEPVEDPIVVYPIEVPDGRCTSDVVELDTGVQLPRESTWDFGCLGPWGTGVNCDAICERVWVFRWTGDRWQQRPDGSNYCSASLDAAGVPPSISNTMLAGTLGSGSCTRQRPRIQEESLGGALRVGDVGERVRSLQVALIERDLLAAEEADGQFGYVTAAAVVDLKFLLGLLRVDGDGYITDGDGRRLEAGDPGSDATVEVLAALGLTV